MTPKKDEASTNPLSRKLQKVLSLKLDQDPDLIVALKVREVNCRYKLGFEKSEIPMNQFWNLTFSPNTFLTFFTYTKIELF